MVIENLFLFVEVTNPNGKLTAVESLQNLLLIQSTFSLTKKGTVLLAVTCHENSNSKINQHIYVELNCSI